MDDRGRKTTPLFVKTYSKFKPRAITPKSVLSPVFPGDGSSFKTTRKTITTGSPCESDISDSTDLANVQPVKTTPLEKKEAIQGNGKRQSKRPSFTPLINISNVLANKPCLSTGLKRVSSPFKKGGKTRKQIGRLDSIQESDTDSTSTEEEWPAVMHRPRRTNSVSSSSLHSGQVAPNTTECRKVGPISGFKLMVKGNRIVPLGTPLASSTAINSGGTSDTSETSEDMEDSTDYGLTTSSEPPSDGSATLTEEMSSDDNTLTEKDEEWTCKEEDGDIEVMRDLPDISILRVRGKKLNLTPKRMVRKYADPMKIPLERLSLNNNQSCGKKQVSFLLSSREDQESPDSGIRKEPYQQAQQLPAKQGILKNSTNESREKSFSKSMIACDKKQKRMSSTPTRGSKKGKMMQLSFDVSAVHLPSYNISDLVEESVIENKTNTHNAEVLPPVEMKESDQVEETKASIAQQDNMISTRVITCQPSTLSSDIVTTQPKDPSIAAAQPSRTTTQLLKTIEQHKSSTQLLMVAKPQKPAQVREVNDQIPVITIRPLQTTAQPSQSADLLDNDVHLIQDIPIPEDTDDMIEGPIVDLPTVQTAESHATPRSQLKRSSPESHVPFTPSKRKWRMKGPSCVTEPIPEVIPMNAASGGIRPQGKRLEYEEKGVGPPECCITKLNHATCSHDGVQVIRYVSTHKMTPKQLKQMPTDVLEVLFA